MSWIRLIEWDRCPTARGAFVACSGYEFAVFRLDDPPRPVVLDNACPHAGGNLSGGTVEGTVVRCPWHDWPFDLDTGLCIHSDKASAVRYPAEVRDGVVWVEIPPLPDSQAAVKSLRHCRPGE